VLGLRLTETLGKLHQRKSHLAFGDRAESLQQPRSIGLSQHFGEWIIAGMRRPAAPFLAEQCADLDTEDISEFLQPATADAISARFVFLDLLEGYTDLSAEFDLRDIPCARR